MSSIAVIISGQATTYKKSNDRPSNVYTSPPPLEQLGFMNYQSNLPHSGQAADAQSKSNPIPIPKLQLIGFNTDTYGLTSNYYSPSSTSGSTFASSWPSSPAFSPNQASFNAPFMGHQTAFPSPSLFVGSLNSLHSGPMDISSIQTSQGIEGHINLSCFGFGPFDGCFTVDDNLSQERSQPAQAPHSMSFAPVDSEDTITLPLRDDSTASSVGYVVPGNPSDHLNGSEVSPPHQGTTSGSTSGSISDPRFILPSSPSRLSPAQLVYCLRHSPYVLEHCLEPTDHRRRSIFLELLRKTPNSQHHFECIVPRPDGTPCAKTFNRADRGLTHIRTHFDHRPFYCLGRCGNQNCSHKFHSNEGLAAHLKPKFDQCRKCHNRYRRQNIRRHEERCPRLR